MMRGLWMVKSGFLDLFPFSRVDMSLDRFYKGIEDAYTYANRTLLKLLIEDQQLLPRLRYVIPPNPFS